jgi:hypothetical protein
MEDEVVIKVWTPLGFNPDSSDGISKNQVSGRVPFTRLPRLPRLQRLYSQFGQLSKLGS